MIRTSWIASSALLLALTAGGAQAADGRTLYVENCAACHRPNGVGVPGAFPTLVGSKVVTGDPMSKLRN